jgi:hypothetical protein
MIAKYYFMRHVFKSAFADIEDYQRTENEHQEFGILWPGLLKVTPKILLLIGKDTHFKNCMF